MDSEHEFEPRDWYDAVYAVVRSVPSGKVVTYGQVAELVEAVTVSARQVGTALRFAPEDVPWQRVVGAGGRLPIAKRSPELRLRQRELLSQEGVPFISVDTGVVDMRLARWTPDCGPQHYGQVESVPV